MKRYEVPRVIFINKLDRYGSDPLFVLGQIRKKLGPVTRSYASLNGASHADFRDFEGSSSRLRLEA